MFQILPSFETKIVILLHFVFFAIIYSNEANPKNEWIQHQKLYFAIAALPNQSYSRAFSKTVANLTQSIFQRGEVNVTLDTLWIDLPENGSFSALFLNNLCEKFEGKFVVAVLLIGESPAAFTVDLAASHIGIPVLWVRGHSGFAPGFRSLTSNPLEVELTPTGTELVSSLRSLLLQAHWHTFTLLADSASVTALRGPDLWPKLNAQPLHPTLIPLPSPLRAQSLFRKLADIARSTRGVVVLLSDRPSAVRILDDAKRLNMMDGHFVWLWIDTSANISIRNATDDKEPEIRRKRSLTPRHEDIAEHHVNYLLQNDRFLLFNGNNYDGHPHYRPVSFDDITLGKPVHRRTSDNEDGSGGHNYSELPAGLLYLRPLPIRVDRHVVKSAVRLLAATLKTVMNRAVWNPHVLLRHSLSTTCWKPLNALEMNISLSFGGELKIASANALAGKKITQEIGVDKVDKSLVANFEILNLVPDRNLPDLDSIPAEPIVKNEIEQNSHPNKWKRVGLVSGKSVRLDTIVWPGGDLSVAAVSTRARTVFRVVTALAPPFVMEGELDEDGQCLRGLPCHRVLTSDKDNLTLVFNEMRRLEDEEDEKEEAKKNENRKEFGEEYESDDSFFPFSKFKYRTNCCYGLAMDLLENIAQELEFDFRLYIAADELFGSKTVIKNTKESSKSKRDVGKKFISFRFKEGFGKNNPVPVIELDEGDEVKWNGIVGDIVSGAAHMSFAALSVTSARSEVIDFSVPYFFSGVSLLAAPKQKNEIPLLAFLLPFSPELWIAIFTSLNITAIAVAIYEWLSPFGLNPWGRQRSKNFSMSSALWVMWGLLCGHLVAFKAPKSWPNKFLINVWGGFSVIFVASYTANIAALIAGLFFQNTVSNYHDRSLLSQKVGAPKSSAAEFYVQRANHHLWQYMHRYALGNVEEGISRLKNGSLDILIADTPILDYYRATDHGCKLQKIGDIINEDTYAIGMSKGFPLKDSISAVIAKYSSNGYMDILQEKWYGGLPCFKLVTDIVQPRPLGVRAVTGVFILLGVGIALGLLILLVEHLFFRYTLPRLREKPKGSVWRSRNIMFFSQKLYRFINCVELVSPHHAARELVHTIRQGQITSLFQKSIKRKEHEQRRRRKSKAQFFEMIQEIRRRQQQETREPVLESLKEVDGENQLSPDDKKSNKLSPSIIKRTFMRGSSPKTDNEKARSPTTLFNKQLFSPRSKGKTKSPSDLNVRRFSTDSVLNSHSLLAERSYNVGRRLSKDINFLSSSPPDMNSRRSSYLDTISPNKLGGKSPVLSIENVSDASSKSGAEISLRKLSDAESIGKKLATLPKYQEVVNKQRLHPQHSLTLGKSDEALAKNEEPVVATAQSYNNVSELNEKRNLSDDEIAKRNQQTIKQLQKELSFNITKHKKQSDNNTFPASTSCVKNTNPQIKIHIEDTTEPKPAQNVTRRLKTRHQSLGNTTGLSGSEPQKRKKMGEHGSKSLDNPGDSSSRVRRRKQDDPLPPAPPPPNCSPRNSNGPSPLERLSKDELVHLWRSSESELRSHLLKAIRDKEEVNEPP